MVLTDFAATWREKARVYSRNKMRRRRSESRGEQVSKKGALLCFWGLPEGFPEGRCPLGRFIWSQLSVAWGDLEDSVNGCNELSGGGTWE